jgi:hypothetical protein
MNSLKSRIIGGTITILAVGLLAVIPALAQTGVDNTAAVNASAASLATSSATTTRGVIKGFNQAQRLAALGARGVKEVDVRVTSLNTLITRVQGLRNVSDAEKSSIVTTLQGLIVNLNSLKDQITTTDSSSTTLRDDIQSITENYRIYALAIPQLNIFAAADRITTVLAMLNTVGGKLQTRLAGSSGVPNMTVLQADLTDFAAKISDANTQVQAAVSEVSPLTPDQGDKTKMASNTATLKDARSKIQAAQKDLVAARKDAQTIITALIKSDKAIMGKTGAATTTTGTTTGTTTP